MHSGTLAQANHSFPDLRARPLQRRLRLVRGHVAAAVSASVLLGALCAAATATTSQPVPPVPVTQAWRVAALCGISHTYLPMSMVGGFRYSAFQVFAHNVYCDAGFAVRFRKGGSRLTWEVAGPQAFALTCHDRSLRVADQDARTVYRRVAGGLDKVWTCLKSRGYTTTVLLYAREGSGVSLAARVRAVASAQTPSAGRVFRSGFQLAPPDVVHRLSRGYGSPFYVPTKLPDGFIFSQWSIRRQDPNQEGRNSLYIDFGNDGAALEWGTYAGRDTFGLACPTRKTRYSPGVFMTIGGVRVFLLVGIQGGSVWRCVPAHSVGNARPLEVELWYSIGLDSRRMERELAEIIATARLVGRT